MSRISQALRTLAVTGGLGIVVFAGVTVARQSSHAGRLAEPFDGPQDAARSSISRDKQKVAEPDNLVPARPESEVRLSVAQEPVVGAAAEPRMPAVDSGAANLANPAPPPSTDPRTPDSVGGDPSAATPPPMNPPSPRVSAAAPATVLAQDADPEKVAEAFVERTHQEARLAVESLTKEAAALRDRLKKVEAALARYQQTLEALNNSRPGSTSLPTVRADDLPTDLEPITRRPVAAPNVPATLPTQRVDSPPSPPATALPAPTSASPELLDPIPQSPPALPQGPTRNPASPVKDSPAPAPTPGR
jgi:hypothetical protein